MLTAFGLPVDDVGFRDAAFEFENCATVELQWPAGATHAAAWRKRYPREGAWTARDAEVRRVARLSEGTVVDSKPEL